MKGRAVSKSVLILTGFLLVFSAGCANNKQTSPLKKQVASLKREKTQLKNRIEQAESENKQLKKQLQVLHGLKDEVKLKDLYDLQKIKVGKYTNLYDKDKDGKREKLIVYVQPMDRAGDIIKAPGAVDIELWDLNRDNGKARLGRWHIKPDELKKLWFTTMFTANYRLTFDVADKIDEFEEPLTVKVTFTDYLTGRVFEEQRVIKPH